MTVRTFVKERLARATTWTGDRLNPILLREVNQSLNGRGLLVTGGVALVAVVIIALVVAAQGKGAAGTGGKVFTGTLLVLLPLLLFVVPLQAFQSMRREVTRGTVDHLHLSRLGPGAIVRGKLAATMVQFVLYFSIFAPLLGMTYLLRGVDVPTIAAVLILYVVEGIGACALAVACGALCRWRSIFRVLPVIVVIVLLGILTFSNMTAVGVSMTMFGQLMAEQFWNQLLYFGPPALMTVVLCGLVGASALAHPHENRSSGFRLFALLTVVLVFAWIGGTQLVDRSSLAGALRMSAIWIPGAAAVCAGALGVFPLFAATEERALSPRVRSRVPRRGLLALLVTPFLPGGGRGVLFGVVLAMVTLGAAALLPPLVSKRPPDPDVLAAAGLAWAYVLLYCGAAGLLRGRLPRGVRWSWVARGAVPLVILGSLLLPYLVDALTQGRMHDGRSVFDFLNPILVIDRYQHRPGAAHEVLAVLACVWALITLFDMRRIVASIQEVQEASRVRRRRAG